LIHATSHIFQIYTPCRINVSNWSPCQTNFTDLYTLLNKRFIVKFSDFISLQAKLFRFMNAASQTFRLIHHASQPFRILHPAGGEAFQIYTPCKTNFSVLYALQNKLFRLLQGKCFSDLWTLQVILSDLCPLQDKFQIDIPCKTNVPYLYTR
jgi:hypothetical protein